MLPSLLATMVVFPFVFAYFHTCALSYMFSASMCLFNFYFINFYSRKVLKKRPKPKSRPAYCLFVPEQKSRVSFEPRRQFYGSRGRGKKKKSSSFLENRFGEQVNNCDCRERNARKAGQEKYTSFSPPLPLFPRLFRNL
jgi:hypothetical protein